VKVYVKINGRDGVHPATVLRTREDGYRVLDVDGGPALVEGVGCEVVPAPEAESCGACWRCVPDYPGMRLCPTCGNKRCPHASDHDLACSGSNEPGQPGSIYGPRRYPVSLQGYVVRRIHSRSRNRYAGALVGYDASDPTRHIETGPIVSIEGRTVTTRSGSVYLLDGPPRWPHFHPGATEADPLRGCEPGGGFYLDTPYPDDVWPPGATVPPVDPA
jgi:hypothetical protein